MIQDAITLKPDGLVVAIFYPVALNDTIRSAVNSGIPVILTNGGFGEASKVGALAFVGSDEHQLGSAGGQLLRKAGGAPIDPDQGPQLLSLSTE
jgi:simple sugar transport system substrate-binding protein